MCWNLPNLEFRLWPLLISYTNTYSDMRAMCRIVINQLDYNMEKYKSWLINSLTDLHAQPKPLDLKNCSFT